MEPARASLSATAPFDELTVKVASGGNASFEAALRRRRCEPAPRPGPHPQRVSAVVSVQTRSRPIRYFSQVARRRFTCVGHYPSSGAGANGKTLLASPNNFFRVSPSTKGAMASKSTAKAPWSSKKATSPASRVPAAILSAHRRHPRRGPSSISINFRKAPSEAARLRWSSVVAHARSIKRRRASALPRERVGDSAEPTPMLATPAVTRKRRAAAATAFATAVDASLVFINEFRSDGDAASASVTDCARPCSEEGAASAGRRRVRRQHLVWPARRRRGRARQSSDIACPALS